MEVTMLCVLLAISLLLFGRVWQRKGIEIYEILVLTNVIYFLFSGIYRHTYSTSENTYSAEIVFTGYMGVILYAFGILAGAACVTSNYYFFNIKESQSSAVHSFKHYYEAINADAVAVLFILSLILRYLYYIKEGRIIYGAEFNEGDKTLSYPVTVLFLFWAIINNGIYAYGLINVIYKKHGHRILCLSIIAAELGFSIISRRDFAFNVIILLTVYLTSKAKITFKAFALTAALSLLTLTLILPFIFDFRKKLAEQYYDTGEISVSIDQLFSDQAEEPNPSEYTDNLATRGYIIASNFELIDANVNNSIRTLNGSVLLSSLTFITPYYLFPSKRESAPPDQLILEHFELAAYDHSENIPYAAYADFGFYGPFIYGLLIGLTVTSLQKYCTRKLDQHPFASVCCLIYLLVHCLNFENLPIIHFILIRNVAIIYISSIVLSNVLNSTFRLSKIPRTSAD